MFDLDVVRFDSANYYGSSLNITFTCGCFLKWVDVKHGHPGRPTYCRTHRESARRIVVLEDTQGSAGYVQDGKTHISEYGPEEYAGTFPHVRLRVVGELDTPGWSHGWYLVDYAGYLHRFASNYDSSD